MTRSRNTTVFTLLAIATAMLITFAPDAAGQDKLAQVPMGALASPTAVGSLDENAPVATAYSATTAGYSVSGSGFLEATGSWIVPTLTCPSSTPVYILTGMSGSAATDTVGIALECVGTKAKYYAYYVFYPYNKNVVLIKTFTPKAGDKISTNVAYVGSGEYSAMIEDVTQGKTFSKVSPVLPGSIDAAGWDVQAAAGYPLPSFTSIANGYDYTSVKTSDWAADSTVIGPISDFGSNILEIIRVNASNAPDLVPSALTTDGSSFKVVRKGP